MNIFNRKKNKINVSETREVLYIKPFSDGGLLFGKLFNDCGALNLSGIFAAIEIITNSIAQLPINIKKIFEGGSEIVYNHPLIGVFKNGLLSKFMMIKAMLKDMYLYGNGYALIHRNSNGVADKLIYLEHGDVSIQWHKNKQELYYLVSGITGYNKVLPQDIIHFYKNTDNGVTGRGILSYAKRSIGISHAAENAAQEFFDSGCNISGILTVNTTLTDLQKSDIRSNWQQTHGGSGKNGICVLPGNMKYEATGSNAAEAQLLESRLFNINEVARFFTISPSLLGDLSKSSYNSIEQAQIDLLIHCLQPVITMMENELTRKLVKEENIVIDIDETFAIKADKKTISEYLTKLVSGGIITVNEARKQLGYEVKENCDDLIIPFTKIEDNTINEDKNTDDEKDD